MTPLVPAHSQCMFAKASAKKFCHNRQTPCSLTEHIRVIGAPCTRNSARRIPVAVACVFSSSLILFFSHDSPFSPLAKGLGLGQTHPHCLLQYAGQRHALARSVDKHLTISLRHRQTNSQITGLDMQLHGSWLWFLASGMLLPGLWTNTSPSA